MTSKVYFHFHTELLEGSEHIECPVCYLRVVKEPYCVVSDSVWDVEALVQRLGRPSESQE